MRTHYEVLGIPRDADPETIKAAYRRALKENHPDLHDGDGDAEARSKAIIDAHAVLKDPTQRARYDEALRLRSQQRRRLFLITLFLTMGAASAASLTVIYGLLAPEQAEVSSSRSATPLAVTPASQNVAGASESSSTPRPSAAPPQTPLARASVPPEQSRPTEIASEPLRTVWVELGKTGTERVAPAPVAGSAGIPAAPSPAPSAGSAPRQALPPTPAPLPTPTVPAAPQSTEGAPQPQRTAALEPGKGVMQQESAKPAAARPEPSPAPQASRWLEQAITAASDSRGLEAPQERALWLIEQVNAAAAALAKAEEPVRSISLETAEPAAVASTQPAATSQLPSQPPPTSAAPLTTAALPAPVEAQAPVPLPSPDVQTEASPPAASEPDQATIGELDKAIARNPGNPDLLLRRASLFSTRGLLARALADYDAAIAIDDRRSRALHGRGLLLVRMGDIDRGLADLDHAIRLSFADPKIYKDRGAIWFHKGSYDRAIADFDRAISLAPDFASAHFYRALALREKGDAAGAAASLAEAARLDPTLAGLVRRMPAPNAVTGSAGR